MRNRMFCNPQLWRQIRTRGRVSVSVACRTARAVLCRRRRRCCSSDVVSAAQLIVFVSLVGTEATGALNWCWMKDLVRSHTCTRIFKQLSRALVVWNYRTAVSDTICDDFAVKYWLVQHAGMLVPVVETIFRRHPTDYFFISHFRLVFPFPLSYVFRESFSQWLNWLPVGFWLHVKHLQSHSFIHLFEWLIQYRHMIALPVTVCVCSSLVRIFQFWK